MSNMPARNRRTARNASSERKGAQSAANLSMQLASAAIWPPSTRGNSPSRRIGNRPRGRPGDARCSRTRRRRGPREIHCPRGRGAATAASTTPRPRRRKRSGRMSLATRASRLRSRGVLPPLTAPGRRWSRKWHKPRTSSQEMHKIGNWQAWPIPKGGEHKRPSLEDSTGNTRDKRVVVADPQTRCSFSTSACRRSHGAARRYSRVSRALSPPRHWSWLFLQRARETPWRTA